MVVRRRGQRVLEFDRAAGGDHRSRQQRRHMAGSGGHRANRDDRSGAPDRAAGGQRAAARAAGAKHVGGDPEWAEGRDDRREPPADAA
jgi:hypothetical protein